MGGALVHSDSNEVVMVGIDAAVVANHRVVVRRPRAGGPGEVIDDFEASPTLAGLDRLSKRLAAYPGAVAVAEPTSMTWLPLSVATEKAGVSLTLVRNRHSARLRAALSGKDKSDVIDAQVLSRAPEGFALEPARIPDAAELALRRAVQRRHKTLIEANRWYRRLLSLSRWAFPDVWIAFGGVTGHRHRGAGTLAPPPPAGPGSAVVDHRRGSRQHQGSLRRQPAGRTDPGGGPSMGDVLGRSPRPRRLGMGNRRTAGRRCFGSGPPSPSRSRHRGSMGGPVGRRQHLVVGAGDGTPNQPHRPGILGRRHPVPHLERSPSLCRGEP